MKKEKLTIQGQYDDMVRKGIKFEKIREAEAKKFLKKNNYYFKLKAYARNYSMYQDKERKGRYIDLEFADLVELSTLDMRFRKLIISLSLDIEHFLKVQLLADLGENEEEDGHNIVGKFFELNPQVASEIEEKAKRRSACSDLIKTHTDKDGIYAAWELVEVLSFGRFINFYELYYSTYKSKNEFSGSLWSVKFLRNAAAHNNCLLNSLKLPYTVNISKSKKIMSQIAKINDIAESDRKKYMGNPVIHDFITLLYVFLRVSEGSGVKKTGMDAINNLFNERMLYNKDFFLGSEERKGNATIVNSYKFVKRVIKYFENRYRK